MDRLLVLSKTKKCRLGIMEDGFARTFTIWVQQVLSITKDCALVAFPASTNTLITTKVDIHQDTSVSRELIICLGHYERYPYSYNEQRSIYHVRDYEVQKLLRVRYNSCLHSSHFLYGYA